MPLIRVVSVLLVLTLSVPAAARVAVVFPFGGLGVSTEDAGRVQRWVEAALASVPGYRWQASARLTKQPNSTGRLAACEGQSRCVGVVLRQVGAELGVVGEVGSLGGGFMIYLRLVDAQGRSVRAVSGVLDPGRDGLRDAARGLAFQLLEPESFTGRLVVKVDVANAWIYVDGKRVAHSPAAPITGLAVGPHALRVTHEAYRDFVRFVSVGFDAQTDVSVKLTAYPVRAEQMRLVNEPETRTATDNELPWYRRWWAVTAFGAVILAGTATTAALLFTRSVPRDAELRVPAATP